MTRPDLMSTIAGQASGIGWLRIRVFMPALLHQLKNIKRLARAAPMITQKLSTFPASKIATQTIFTD
jgi:hypothetical protein